MAEGWFLQCHNPEAEVKHLLLDSRQIQQSQHTIFFAIAGLRQDGHDFIGDLYKRGIKNFVVSGEIDLSDLPEANIIQVRDVIRALQSIVQSHRTSFDIPVIGITGSNGKTIVKEWLAHLLFLSYDLVKSPKSFNSQIGVPLSVWQMSFNADMAIFEAGISQPGEMQFLESIIQPTIGIFTNIGAAHDKGFVDLNQKLAEKARLFERTEIVVCCSEHDQVVSVLEQHQIPTFQWSTTKRDADVFISSQSILNGHTTITYRFKEKEAEITIPFENRAAIENALHCLATILFLGVAERQWVGQFNTLPVVEMRLEAKDGINNCLIINDVYSADLTSLSTALAFARQQNQHENRTLILSDFEQYAGSKEDLYRRVAEMLIPNGFGRLLLIGKDVIRLKQFVDKDALDIQHFRTTEDLLHILPELHFHDELILLKGARSFVLERISNALSLKHHQTVLEVNLGALARNLKKFEARLASGVKIMAMVKAAAYGSGGIEIARFLESRNLEYLAVAYADEGAELRNAGIRLPIMVLTTDYESIPSLFKYNLEPEVFSLDQLARIAMTAVDYGRKLPIHLKLETGMHRLGFESSDIEKLNAALFKWKEAITVRSIFSHLAVSDDEDEYEFTELQIALFRELNRRIEVHQNESPIRHILNSHGIMNHPEAQFEMVRLGVGMYGIGSFRDMDLEVVHQLKTSILQIKTVLPGSTIGYGRHEAVKHKMLVATVGIGYADGLIRKAGNRRYALIVNGVEAPIVGNICMDMTMIDVTDVPNVSIGMEVSVFGLNPTVDALAKAADTIPYEVFTNISRRVKRLYIYD